MSMLCFSRPIKYSYRTVKRIGMHSGCVAHGAEQVSTFCNIISGAGERNCIQATQITLNCMLSTHVLSLLYWEWP